MQRWLKHVRFATHTHTIHTAVRSTATSNDTAKGRNTHHQLSCTCIGVADICNKSAVWVTEWCPIFHCLTLGYRCDSSTQTEDAEEKVYSESHDRPELRHEGGKTQVVQKRGETDVGETRGSYDSEVFELN